MSACVYLVLMGLQRSERWDLVGEDELWWHEKTTMVMCVNTDFVKALLTIDRHLQTMPQIYWLQFSFLEFRLQECRNGLFCSLDISWVWKGSAHGRLWSICWMDLLPQKLVEGERQGFQCSYSSLCQGSDLYENSSYIWGMVRRSRWPEYWQYGKMYPRVKLEEWMVVDCFKPLRLCLGEFKWKSAGSGRYWRMLSKGMTFICVLKMIAVIPWNSRGLLEKWGRVCGVRDLN